MSKQALRGLLVLILLSLGAGVFLWDPNFSHQARNFLFQSPCDNPRTYKLGALDARFGLKTGTALTDIQTAAGLWGAASGQKLFQQNPSGEITINFVYDARSALNQQIDTQKSRLSQSNSSLDKQIQSYDRDVTAFEAKLKDFNARIQAVNASGGATPEQYDSLVAAQNQLKAEGDALNQRASQLNLATKNYNTSVKSLNQNISAFNQAITQKPEEGSFDPASDSIAVYFTSNQNELIHTLAHELGHSLGMSHTADPSSIMNSQTSAHLAVTDADKQELARVCQNQFVLVLLARKLLLWTRFELVAILATLGGVNLPKSL